MPIGNEVGLSPGHSVLDGDPVGTQPHSSSSQFTAHAYCGQTVAHLSNCWALVYFGGTFSRLWILRRICQKPQTFPKGHRRTPCCLPWNNKALWWLKIMLDQSTICNNHIYRPMVIKDGGLIEQNF